MLDFDVFFSAPLAGFFEDCDVAISDDFIVPIMESQVTFYLVRVHPDLL